jgi:hypothetical protein
MNASSIEIVSGATVSADGVRGMPYGSDASYLGTGGGGSGGSILMEARNVSGGGLVSAKGGPSRGGSGAGGGGRVSIRAAHVSSQLVVCPLLPFFPCHIVLPARN